MSGVGHCHLPVAQGVGSQPPVQLGPCTATSARRSMYTPPALSVTSQCLLTLALHQHPSKNAHPLPMPCRGVPVWGGGWEGPAEPGHCPQAHELKARLFGCPFYRPVSLLPHISLLGCAYSSRHRVKNTSLPLIIHLSRSRQDFDLKGKAFPEIWLLETHAKRAPRHQPLSLLGKF